MSADFEAGKKAFLDGLTTKDNPYISGTTKLGNPKFSDFDLGSEWERGFYSVKPAPVPSKADLAASAKLDVSRFRRKSNRYYGR